MNTRNGADCSILETSWSMSQFYTAMGKRRMSRHNFHLKHIHAVHNSTKQKDETVWCIYLCSWRVVWIEIMVPIKGFNLLVTKLFLKSLQCVCLLSKCSLKLTMCLLVIKVSLKSLQCVCLLSKCLLKASQMRGHLNTCLSTKFPLHTCLDIPSNWNWGNQAQLKQSWSFYTV